MYELHHACHKVYSIKYHLMFCIKYRKDLFQSSPKYSPSKVVQIIKSITAIELFKKFPELKEGLWGW